MSHATNMKHTDQARMNTQYYVRPHTWSIWGFQDASRTAQHIPDDTPKRPPRHPQEPQQDPKSAQTTMSEVMRAPHQERHRPTQDDRLSPSISLSLFLSRSIYTLHIYIYIYRERETCVICLRPSTLRAHAHICI
jgi:hypothetical protein